MFRRQLQGAWGRRRLGRDRKAQHQESHCRRTCAWGFTWAFVRATHAIRGLGSHGVLRGFPGGLTPLLVNLKTHDIIETSENLPAKFLHSRPSDVEGCNCVRGARNISVAVKPKPTLNFPRNLNCTADLTGVWVLDNIPRCAAIFRGATGHVRLSAFL